MEKFIFIMLAIFKSTTFGTISGKHGTAVGATTAGKSVLRVHTVPRNPRTPAQLKQRLTFVIITAILRPLNKVCALGFGNRNGVYQAISIGIRTAIQGTYPNLTVNYSKLQISSGELPKSSEVGCTRGTGNQITVTWGTEFWNMGTANDRVILSFIEEGERMVYTLDEYPVRSAGSITFTFPGIFTGKTIHGWIFFTSPDQAMRSNSQYLGPITLS